MTGLLQLFSRICNKISNKIKLSLLLCVIGGISLFVAVNSQFAAEYIFARGIYKLLSIPTGLISGALPFSIAELVLIGLIIAVPMSVIYWLVKGISWIGKTRKNKAGIKAYLKAFAKLLSSFIQNIILIGSILFMSFVLLCGTNYYRYDFVKYCEFEVGEYTKEDLAGLCEELVLRTNEARAHIATENSKGIMVLEESISKTSAKAAKAMRGLAGTYKSIGIFSGRAKGVMLSKYMSYTEIVGIFCPFTMEANVNVHVVDYNIPFSMCHELAHLCGYMKEDEANFIAFLACIESDDWELIYSGYSSALIYASNELYDIDKDAYYDIMSKLDEKVTLDMDADYNYWKAYEETEAGQVIGEVSNQVNNSYLQINGQKDGVQSYNEIVELLLARYKSYLETK